MTQLHLIRLNKKTTEIVQFRFYNMLPVLNFNALSDEYIQKNKILTSTGYIINMRNQIGI